MPESRWECQSPAHMHGGGYSFVKLRFPCCLWDYPGVYQRGLHTYWHFRGSKKTWALVTRLLRWGFVEAESEGCITAWQWRFWRGSPLRSEMLAHWTKDELEGTWD